MNQQLEQIASHLRAMQPDMKRMGDAMEPVLKVDVVAAYIQQANLMQCKSIIDALVGRVSELVGVASELEDASVTLSKEIAYEALNELWEGRR